MNTLERALYLWSTGNFRDPDHPECHGVKKSDLDTFSGFEPEFLGAVQSRQEFFAQQLDWFALAIHGRLAATDGEPGPATDALLTAKRCPHPDFEITPEDDEELAKLWARPEEANWPTECRSDLHIGRDFQGLPGLTREQTDGVYWAICHNWTEAFADIQLTPRNDAIGNASGTRMYHRKERMGGGTLAYHYLARNRCDDRLDGAWNSAVTWNLSLAPTTGSHEVGHGFGCNHVNDPAALMYPMITNASQQRLGFPNSTDIAAMQALGYTPHADWKSRQLPKDRLFLPRGLDDDPLDRTLVIGWLYEDGTFEKIMEVDDKLAPFPGG